MKKFLEVMLGLTLAIINCTIISGGANAKGCSDVKVIWVNGSGAVIDGTDNNYNDFKMAVTDEIKYLKKSDGTNIDFSFYELGTEEHGGYKYPAIGIGTESLKNMVTSLGAFVSGGNGYDYGESVMSGGKEMAAYISEESEKCPNMKFVIGGLSQGAEVISTALNNLNSEKILYVATFGDPKLFLPEGKNAKKSVACKGRNLSNYREYVPDCWVYEGILGGNVSYAINNFANKLGAFCNHFDAVCTSRVNFLNLSESLDPHGSYGNSFNKDHIYEMAARIIAEKIDSFYTGREIPEKIQAENIAILLDTTGSMTDYWTEALEKVLAITDKAFERKAQVALFQYKDTKTPKGFGKDYFDPEMICGFDGDINHVCTKEKIEYALNNLKVEGGGSDFYESVLAASWHMMNTLNWTERAIKSAVVVTDDGFHPMENFYGLDLDLPLIVNRSFEIDPVNFYSVIPENRTFETQYRELAFETNGDVFYFGSQNTLLTGTIFGGAKETPNPNLPKIINADAKKISKNEAFVTFETRNADRVVIVVNDVILGNTTLNNITISDLDFTRENRILLLPYTNDGIKGENYELILEKDSEANPEPIIPKTPDCGIVKNVL